MSTLALIQIFCVHVDFKIYCVWITGESVLQTIWEVGSYICLAIFLLYLKLLGVLTKFFDSIEWSSIKNAFCFTI